MKYTKKQKLKIFKRFKLRIQNGHMTKRKWDAHNKFISEIAK